MARDRMHRILCQKRVLAAPNFCPRAKRWPTKPSRAGCTPKDQRAQRRAGELSQSRGLDRKVPGNAGAAHHFARRSMEPSPRDSRSRCAAVTTRFPLRWTLRQLRKQRCVCSACPTPNKPASLPDNPAGRIGSTVTLWTLAERAMAHLPKLEQKLPTPKNRRRLRHRKRRNAPS